MKKLVSVLFVSLLVGGIVTAADPKIEIKTWARSVFNLVQDAGDDTDMTASYGPSWANGGRVRFDVIGTADNYGFLFNGFYHGGTTFVAPDNAKIWFKFNDMVTLQMGRMRVDTLRGRIGDSDMLATTNQDAIFQRFLPNAGMLLELKPVKGLYVGAALDTDNYATTYSVATPNVEYVADFETMMKNIQVAAGYTIDKVGLVRAQYIGAGAGKPINAAFAYTGMKGLLVDAGIYFPTEETTYDMKIGASVSYAQAALALVVRTNTVLADDVTFQASADATYGLSKNLFAGAELQFINGMASAVSTSQTTSGGPKYTDVFTIAPYAKFAYGNGFFKAGFVANVGLGEGTSENFSWSVPLVMQVAF